MKRTFLLAILTLSATIMAVAQVGTWKAYMAYHDITNVQKVGNTLYVLASNSLYTYNTNDKSIQTYDKTNGLSDCEIKYIAWCQSAKRLLIAYSNGNFDIMDSDGEITNLPDFYNKTMTEDKTINDINIYEKYAYISTGFGILKIDVANAEIQETYNLGFNVNYSYIQDGKVFAASSAQGIYTASLNDNLQDPTNWSYNSTYSANTKTIDSNLLAIAKTLNPGGPNNNNMGYLKYKYNKLYTTVGSMEMPAAIQIFDGNSWHIYDDSFKTSLSHRYVGTFSIDIDPTDTTRTVTASQTGVQVFKNGVFLKEYSIDNSPFKVAATVSNDNLNYVVVTDAVFDNSGNLWCLNSISPSTSIIELTHNGEWVSHHKQELVLSSTNRSLDFMTSAKFDSRKLLWFTNNDYRQASFYCYQPSTDALNSFIPTANQDGTLLSLNNVACIAEDRNGDIWVGTDIGPLLLYADDITSEIPTYNQVKVPRNDGTNLADYLLKNVNITAIAIDGANRKWFGTNGSGLYLISADNMIQIQHFTISNSPLLSNNIYSLALDDEKGILYIGTDKGLCSYNSDTTTPSESMDKDNVYAYPNPIAPEYRGEITIVGLSYNADVKIVASNGILIYEGRSNGGSFTWNGCDKDGKRVASGIYMVETATSDGKKGTVCKIAMLK